MQTDRLIGLRSGVASSTVRIIGGLSIFVALLVGACGPEPSKAVVNTVVPSPLPSPVVPPIPTPTPEVVEPAGTPTPEPTATPMPVGSWSVPAPMIHARSGHFGVRLADGRVLVGGGLGVDGLSQTTEIYFPADDNWLESGELNVARESGVAALLADGRVLVTGGNSASDDGELDSAEVFDPETGKWTLVDAMATRRNGHSATTLGDGRVLVAGGADGGDYPDLFTPNVQLFDPETDTWESAEPMTVGLLQNTGGRAGHGAVLLTETQVMIVAGIGFGSGGLPDLASSIIFDSTTGEWTDAGPMLNGRRNHATTLLSDGQVVVTGGQGPQPFAEIYDPEKDIWNGAGVNIAPRLGHEGIALSDGGLLIFGGWGGPSFNQLASAEFLPSGSNTWEDAGEMSVARGGAIATLLEDGRVLVAGGGGGDSGSTNLVEVFTTNE